MARQIRGEAIVVDFEAETLERSQTGNARFRDAVEGIAQFVPASAHRAGAIRSSEEFGSLTSV
jgi:hypothetical protein